MKPALSLRFTDFWGGFSPTNNYFTQLLSTRYRVTLAEEPDLHFYSCFGRSYRRVRARSRVYFTGENTQPNFRECDFAFTFEHLSRTDHFRLPLYAWYGDPARLVKGAVDAEAILARKTGFCNFVYSNPRCKFRIKFFEKLSKYKRVDSGGRLLNNIGGPVQDKLSFLSNYKFTIAFENDSHPGYTTEKIAEPMHAWSLPIYWGNPLVHLDFNPQSFLNYFDYGDLDALIERVIELDRDDELYCRYLREPWFHRNEVNEYVRPEDVLAKLEEVIESRAAGQWRRSRLLPWRTVRAAA